ncbi:MAG TPA: TetR/AcrR family transcriptional regulator [Candidatus Dormibacteraeota bacterium]|nr:TetR/AcrR family transcriptional regulator [Candidatus Dormibacteraeota bacterium]
MVEQPHGDQGLQTRDRILATAARLFSENGYEHTPLSQVAREAQVSKALVLWHFDSKEALFRAALGRTLEPYHLDVEDLDGLDERAQIELLMDRFYEFVRGNVYSVRFFFGLLIRAEPKRDDVIGKVSDLYDLFRSVLADIIERGRARGLFRADANPRLDASLILVSLGGILIEQLMRDRDQSAELMNHLKQTVFRRLIA